MLAARMEFWRQVALMILALLVTYTFVYTSGADRQPPSGHNSRGKKIWPWADTLMSYAVALLVSLGMLYLFGQISSATPLDAILANTIVLALPASIGGAAGKLALA